MSFPLTTYTSTAADRIAGARQHNAGDIVLAGGNKESTAAMSFGRFVRFERSTDDKGMLNPDAITQKLAGVVVHSYDYAAEDLGLGSTSPGDAALGVLPGKKVNVLAAGIVCVVAEVDCTPGDPVFVRCVAGAGEVEGSTRNAADSTDCIDLTGKAYYISSRVGGLAWIRLIGCAT